MTASVYAFAAQDAVYRSDWAGVLPLPARAKKSPPIGFTGADGRWPTAEDIERWSKENPSGNVALRLPDGIIGLDLDVYKDAGRSSYLALTQKLGDLPPTWISTSRDDGSGIYFFRVPPGTRLQGAPRPGIEVVQHHHRYAVVWPSIHPEGRPYHWYDPEDIREESAIPMPDALPWLPDAWLEELRERVATNGQAASRPRISGEWARAVRDAYGEAMARMTQGGRHDAALAGACALARLEDLGYPGADKALDALGRTFTASITDRAKPEEAQREWRAIVASAWTTVGSTPATAVPWADTLECRHQQRDDQRRGRPVDPNNHFLHDSKQRTKGEAKREGLPWRSLDTVQPEAVEFLWHPYIPMGKVTILGGDPGVGKGFVYTAIGAYVTRGDRLPHGGKPLDGIVLVANFEDGDADTIRPRFDAAKADVSRVMLLDQFFDANGRRRHMSPDDIPDLDDALDALPEARLLVIDPAGSFVGQKINTDKDNQVRSVMQPLADLAARRNIAVVVVMHLNKSELAKVLYRIGGSIGFVGLARSVLAVANVLDDNGQETDTKAVAHIKSNLARKGPVIEFTLEDGACWFGKASTMTAEDLLGGNQDKRPANRPADKRDDCIDLLQQLLEAGPVPARVGTATLMQAGHSERTIARARKHLGVVAERDAIEWAWKLPA